MTHIKSFKVDVINKRKKRKCSSQCCCLVGHTPSASQHNLTFPFDEKIGAPAAHQSVSTLFALVLFISAQDKHTQGKIQKTEDAET